jgi:hypothetical protein
LKIAKNIEEIEKMNKRSRKSYSFMKSKSRVKIAAGIIIIVTAVTILSIFVVINLAQKPSQEVLKSNAKLNNAGYLGGSKLFLVSANAAYGVHGGQACFIITATMRNDYTEQQPPPMDNSTVNSSGTAYFGLTATLYCNNAQISANDITCPGSVPLGVPQIALASGQTTTVEIDMATSDRNISSYIIDPIAVEGYPIP